MKKWPIGATGDEVDYSRKLIKPKTTTKSILYVSKLSLTMGRDGKSSNRRMQMRERENAFRKKQNKTLAQSHQLTDFDFAGRKGI